MTLDHFFQSIESFCKEQLWYVFYQAKEYNKNPVFAENFINSFLFDPLFFGYIKKPR